MLAAVTLPTIAGAQRSDTSADAIAIAIGDAITIIIIIIIITVAAVRPLTRLT
jgi:hypothetical protein